MTKEGGLLMSYRDDKGYLSRQEDKRKGRLKHREKHLTYKIGELKGFLAAAGLIKDKMQT